MSAPMPGTSSAIQAPTLPAGAPAQGASPPEQRIIKIRRDYNSWVASETIEDYALRFTAQRARKWSEWRVANTAFGAASFLILEAVGATLVLTYGWSNALWAILATGLIIFLAGLPISVYAARYGLDMDLLTRGAGFGYLGSTLTSLIYASFTFIFFALEAAVMAYALELAFGLPPAWGYGVCALVVIPMVTHGVSTIGRLQIWTQPLWLALLVVPFIAVLTQDPHALSGLIRTQGELSGTSQFTVIGFGAALTVGIALMTQMGEQVDYLRFMPDRSCSTRWRWWSAVIAGGPGWVVMGVLKMLGGALLASIAVRLMVPSERAVDPNQMYLVAYDMVFSTPGLAIAVTALFVIVSQIKINVTNAYAGSLAWSNFFSRVTHSHPGRVVWVVFNTAIAFILMELSVFEALGQVLGLFSNIAISWLMAVVADLLINKPMGWSPKGIEFRRAYLYDINPVGVGAMLAASLLSMAAHLGVFGELAQAFSAMIALVTAMVVSPLIAWGTKGRYYISREPPAEDRGAYLGESLRRCVICERAYEPPDMAHCPAYGGSICSLCCTLDARCHDACKPKAKLLEQWAALLRRVLPGRASERLDTGLALYSLLMLLVVPALAGLMALLAHQSLRSVGQAGPLSEAQRAAVQVSYLHTFVVVLVIAAVGLWWLVLARNSRRVAQEESSRQNQLLLREIESHRITDEKLQQAKHAADLANRAKSRYVSTLSHEFRTPLNGILGYAQLLAEDPSLPVHRRHAVSVIRRGGEHLLSLIEGTLDIARIESGKLSLESKPIAWREMLDEIAQLIELQAASKGLRFQFIAKGRQPAYVRGDEKRVRQILLNLLGNALKFTATGEVQLVASHQRDMALIEVIDTGCGMSAEELSRVFEPFARAESLSGSAPGTGLGLTIARMLADLMGGELNAQSTPGEGSRFVLRLFLPELDATHAPAALAPASQQVLAWHSLDARVRRRILIVDNEDADRDLLTEWLEPLGFDIEQASSGGQALERVVAGSHFDAIFLDLAMPGLDGWQTLERLRTLQAGASVPVAIVSANAFDRIPRAQWGIGLEDFIIKPVRKQELLDWLARRVQVAWVSQPVAVSPTAEALFSPRAPIEGLLRPVVEAARIGYVRGVLQHLDALELQHPEHAASVAIVRELAQGFQFDAIVHRLSKAA